MLADSITPDVSFKGGTNARRQGVLSCMFVGHSPPRPRKVSAWTERLSRKMLAQGVSETCHSPEGQSC